MDDPDPFFPKARHLLLIQMHRMNGNKPGVQDVQPVNGDFAWLNQGGASTDDTYGPLYLTAPGATVNIRGREKNAPATPYTITGVMMSGAMTKTNYSTYGVYFRETGSSKLETFEWRGFDSADRNLRVSQWTGPAAWSSTPSGNLHWLYQHPMFFQFEDDGTNLVYRTSVNGQVWDDFYTQLRGAWFTTAPDKVGFFINHANANSEGAVLLLSWKEE